MSKELRQVEVQVCDFCGKDGAYYHCRGCRKDCCYDCKSSRLTVYHKSVHCESSDDLLYCAECNAKAIRGGDELLNAFMAVEKLRREQNGFWVDFKERMEKAEAKVKRLLEKE